MSIMVPTKQKPLLDTQKIVRKEFKQNTKESHQTTREESKSKRKEQKVTTKQPENNEQNGNKYIPINNYFKCKSTEFFNQKT